MATRLHAGPEMMIVQLMKFPNWQFLRDTERLEGIMPEELTPEDIAVLEKQKRENYQLIPHAAEPPEGYWRVWYDMGGVKALVTGRVVSVGPHRRWDNGGAMPAPCAVDDLVVVHCASYHDRNIFARHPGQDAWFLITETRNLLCRVSVK